MYFFRVIIFMLIKLTRNKEIKFICDFKTTNFSITNEIFSNCCKAVGSLKILNENDVLVPSNFNQGSNVECFVAEKMKFAYFPNDIEKLSHSLTHVTIKNSGLVNITERNLKKYQSLEYLDLSENKIEILDKDLFKTSKKLVRIILSNNKIRFIHPDAFLSYDHYKYLDLQNNICISNLSVGGADSYIHIHHLCSSDDPSKNIANKTDEKETTIKPNVKDSIETEILMLKSRSTEQNENIQKLTYRIEKVENLIHQQNNAINELISNINSSWYQHFSSFKQDLASNFTFNQNIITEMQNLINPRNRSTLSHQEQVTNDKSLEHKSGITNYLLFASNILCFFILIIIIIYLICSKKSSKYSSKLEPLENEPSKLGNVYDSAPQIQLNLAVPENVYQTQASYEEINYEAKVTNNLEIEDFYAEIVNEDDKKFDGDSETYDVIYKSTDTE